MLALGMNTQDDHAWLADLACLFANIGQGSTSLKLLEGLARVTGKTIYFGYAAHVKSRYGKGTAADGLRYMFGKLGKNVFSEYSLIFLAVPLLLRSARFSAALGLVRLLINSGNKTIRTAALGINATIRQILQSPNTVM
jgi:hypothetical protein